MASTGSTIVRLLAAVSVSGIRRAVFGTLVLTSRARAEKRFHARVLRKLREREAKELGYRDLGGEA